MALRVWLPLTGNLENKGCSGIVPTASNPSYTNGKIGQCYNGGDLTITTGYTFGKVWSFAFWGYVIGSQITSNWTLIARLNDGGTNLRIEVCPSSYSNGIYCYSTHNNSSYNITTGSVSSPAGGYYDQWAHFCLTSDGTTITKYMNGNKIGTCSYNGSGQINGTFVLANNNKIYKNDVRIYDHCLSAAEVKEISQGLVLHYKLDGGTYSQSNLLPCGNTYTSSSPLVRTSKATDGAAWVSNSAFEATPSTTYTISVECDGTLSNTHGRGNLAITDKPWSFWLYICNADTTKNWSGGAYDTPVNFNSSNHNFRKIGNVYVWTYTLSSTQKYISVRTNTYSDGTNNITVNFWNLKIEKGNVYTPWSNTNSTTIVDSSGYGHNGTINGTLTLSSDTPRYSNCTVFNGSNARIHVPNLMPAELTISFWMKRGANTGTRQFMYTAWNGITCELQTNGTPTFAVNRSSYPTITGTAITTDSGWVHYCATFDTINGSKLYQNGILKSSNNNVTPIVYNITTNYIGYYNTYYNGKMSDFRIYCTALSAADIEQLYEVGAKVDNLHNIHTFEYSENSSAIKLTKQGQLKEGEIQEDTTTKFYKTDKIIKAKQFIER